MVSRSGNKGFLVAHYDWLAAGVGVLALVGALVYFITAMGADSDQLAMDAAKAVDRMKPSETGVKPVDMEAFGTAMRITKSPVTVAEVSEKAESFLSSERRVLCKCGKAISGDIKAVPKCPYCGEPQHEEKKVVLDADADGLPDEWEKKYGLNPGNPADANEDLDGDGFTNVEEFAAKTDPSNRNDHPDYLDSLKIVLPLKETYMPFVFTMATKIPAGWRCEFYDANLKNDYGQKGKTITAVVGEEIGNSGYILKNYEKKEAKRAIKGGQGLQKTVDVSVATVERKSDGKVVPLTIVANKKTRPASVDVQVTLVYERGTVANFEVVPGAEIDLNGTKYKISEISAVGKGAKVVVENALSGKKRTLEALEQ